MLLGASSHAVWDSPLYLPGISMRSDSPGLTTPSGQDHVSFVPGSLPSSNTG